jgi:hypothetical protein
MIMPNYEMEYFTPTQPYMSPYSPANYTQQMQAYGTTPTTYSDAYQQTLNTAQNQSGNWMGGLLGGGNNKEGGLFGNASLGDWGNLLGGLGGLGQLYFGYSMLKDSRDRFEYAKQEREKDREMQKKGMNYQLYVDAKNRNRFDPTIAAPAEQVMARWGY